MSRPCWKRVPLCTVLLLLFSVFGLLIIPVSQAQEEEDAAVSSIYFPPTLEFALHTFNEESKDEYAYRVINILQSWVEEVDFPTVFSMKLQLGRTICRKFDENLDVCPFQKGSASNNTITCLFTIGTFPWTTYFSLLNHLCLE